MRYALLGAIASDLGPIGTDTKRADVLILHLQDRLARLEGRLDANEGRGEAS